MFKNVFIIILPVVFLYGRHLNCIFYMIFLYGRHLVNEDTSLLSKMFHFLEHLNKFFHQNMDFSVICVNKI